MDSCTILIPNKSLGMPNPLGNDLLDMILIQVQSAEPLFLTRGVQL